MQPERSTFLALLLSILLAFSSSAALVPLVASAANDQVGDNASSEEQKGGSESGDAIAGQVTGGTFGGRAQVDATNTSRDVDVNSGDAEASNTSEGVVGQSSSTSESGGSLSIQFCANNIAQGESAAAISAFGQVSCSVDEFTAAADNVQDGDNASDLAQAANATTGDAVGGQVIGVASTGDTQVRVANTSEDVDISTGDAESRNDAVINSGLLAEGSNDPELVIQACGNNIAIGDLVTATQSFDTITCSIDSAVTASNVQDGDNGADTSQAANATSGDGVGGQVLGIASSGNTTVDATNSSTDVDIETGSAESINAAEVSAGLLTGATGGGTVIQLCGNNVAQGTISVAESSNNTITCSIEGDISAANIQDGDNDAALNQSATASSGDGVGGQVIGVASSGDTDVVAANRSRDVDVATGDSSSSNEASVTAGLQTTGIAGGGLIIQACGNNIAAGLDTNAVSTGNEITCSLGGPTESSNSQEGDNAADAAQAADASSGDGVGGQVIGVAGAGDTSIDAANTSDSVDVATGDSEAANDAVVGAGLLAAPDTSGGAFEQVCGNNFAVGVIAVAVQVDQTISCTNTFGDGSANSQDGDNDAELVQSANSATGDGVAGQVIGVVPSNGGSADLVVANTSIDIDAETGNDGHSNTDETFVGLRTGTLDI